MSNDNSKLSGFKDKITKFLTPKNKPTYFLTRFVFLRLLGFVYFFAFLSLATQVIPLLGGHGLLPAKNLIDAYGSRFDSTQHAFNNLPTIFLFGINDKLLLVLAWIGVILSFIVMIGFSDSIIMFILWLLYLSYINIGQLWYSYGWEIQLLETGFLAVFLVPLLDLRPFPKHKVPVAIIWLLRWLTFRIMLGAGLIKIRGDSCWKDLTCLIYHYQTQPIPNPLSPYFHFMPVFMHKLGALFNHFVELIVPFFVFWPRLLSNIAGFLIIFFQFILIFSGNLSFLNWITIVAAVSCFDDNFLRRILPKFIVRKSDESAKKAKEYEFQKIISWIVFIIVAFLSIAVVQNLLSSNQIMNTSFNNVHLVNTYGAFGSVGKERYELILEGTNDEVINEKTEWKEYEFKYKPGNPYRKLPIIAPYQPRIDWQIWFAAFSAPEREPWLIHFIWKLLHNDKDTLSLIANNPFPDNLPKYIKIEFYKYEFAKPGTGKVWNRTYVGQWLPPISTETKGLRDFIKANRWELYDKVR